MPANEMKFLHQTSISFVFHEVFVTERRISVV